MKEFYLQPKLVSSMKGYSGGQFMKDLIAGLIVAIIALPLSIALALASGAAPEQGVYTAIFAGFTVSLLGGSRIQIAGPTAAFATIVAGIIASQGMEGLILATLMAGIILIIMGVCKLGGLIRFVPTTITVGFTAGIATVEDVQLMKANVTNGVQVKASAGIRTYADAMKLIEAGADRLGTSAGIAIIESLNK